MEGGAAVRIVFGPKFAAMSGSDGSTDGEAETEAFFFSGEKRFKQAILLL